MENKHLECSGKINFYTGITTGKLYWEVILEIPLDISPNSIFREIRIVPQLSPPTPLITDFAWAFEQISEQFKRWALYLEKLYKKGESK